MYEKLENVLKELNIELAFQEYSGNSEEYIIYDIFNDRESEWADDKAIEKISYITINYYHKSLSKLKNYDVIKKHLKDNGFSYDDSTTLNKKDGYYGRNFLFTIGEEC